MSCTIAEDLTAYVDRELPVFQVRKVENHLASCGECRATEQLLRRSVGHLAHLPDFALSSAVRRAVLGRIDEEAKHSLIARLASLWRPQVLIPSLGLLAAAMVALATSREHRIDMRELRMFELGANLQLAEDYELLGVKNLDDLEVVLHLHELEDP
jgi:anti-sigma factor RsiW